MGEVQLSLIEIVEFYEKPKHNHQTNKPDKKTAKKNNKEPHVISLFKSSGVRHDGLYGINEKFKCLKCERKINLMPRRFCQDCKCSGAYRFSECY